MALLTSYINHYS